jgi:CubicO group peptidase (beta-lactamase class C family)
LALLSHTSGLPAWRNFWIGRLDERDSVELLPTASAHVEKVLARYPKWVQSPGKEVYSDIGFILLAYCLSFVEKQNLAALWESWCVRRGLSKDQKLGFNMRNAFGDKDFATTGFCKLRGRQLYGEVHDENCAALGGAAGHAGLFGSGAAFSAYLRKFVGPLLGSALPQPLMGFRPGDEEFLRRSLGPETVGHWGFTGTGFWFNPVSGNFLVLLTNRTYRYRVTPMIREFRAAVVDAAGPLFAR